MMMLALRLLYRWMYEHPGYIDALKVSQWLGQKSLCAHICELDCPSAFCRLDIKSATLVSLQHLNVLRQRGKIRHLALTNFDTAHLAVVLSLGIPIVANQVGT